MDKEFLRNSILQKRKKMSADEHDQKSSAISEKLIGIDSVKNAKLLAVYLSVHNEVSLHSFIDAMQKRGKQIVVPVMSGNVIQFAFFEKGSELKKNSFGVDEPDSPKFADPSKIDVFIVPGSAFDHSGNRLGYGKGFFDKFFNESNPRGLKIGVCFDFQVVESIPVENFDVKMDLILTESAIHKFS